MSEKITSIAGTEKIILTTVKGIENLENLTDLRVWLALNEACPELCDQPAVTFELKNKKYLALMDWTQFKENLCCFR